ncbi:uncharacterized protein [Euphorbia lathyris]|uniref:uncharacterized protein n=1 Tax=Euphorbia lathyris TaxID=212925 RepID=UPI0033143D05
MERWTAMESNMGVPNLVAPKVEIDVVNDVGGKIGFLPNEGLGNVVGSIDVNDVGSRIGFFANQGLGNVVGNIDVNDVGSKIGFFANEALGNVVGNTNLFGEITGLYEGPGDLGGVSNGEVGFVNSVKVEELGKDESAAFNGILYEGPGKLGGVSNEEVGFVNSVKVEELEKDESALNGILYEGPGDLGDVSNEEVGFVNSVKVEELEEDGSARNGIPSGRKLEVCEDSMSFYVDFPGYLRENSSTAKRAACSEEIGDEEMAGLIGNFCIGDIVWIRRKSNSWWPGKIYDPLDALKYDVKSAQKNCLLVGGFGGEGVAWCLPSQLKRFHENFDEMVGENREMSFLLAISEAVHEAGKCFKSAVTCSSENSKPTNGEFPCTEAQVQQQKKDKDLLETFGGENSKPTNGELPCTEAQVQQQKKDKHLLGTFGGENSKPTNGEFPCTEAQVQQQKNDKDLLETFGGENSKPTAGELPCTEAQVQQEKKDKDLHLLETFGGENSKPTGGELPCIGAQVQQQKKDKDLIETFGGENSKPTDGELPCTEAQIQQQKKDKDLIETVGGDLNTTENNCRGKFHEGNVVPNDPASNFRKSKKKISKIEVESRDVSLSASLSQKETDILLSPATAENFELRERKKSKYLMYPYVNLENKGLRNEIEASKAQEAESEKTVLGSSVSKSSGKRVQKKWFRKLKSDSDVSSNPKLINASAVDLLSELCFTAVDCQYPNEQKDFDIIEWFFSKFRTSVYQDKSISEMQCKSVPGTGSSNEALPQNDSQETSQTLQDIQAAQKMQKKKNKKKEALPQNDSQETCQTLQDIKAAEKMQKKKNKKKDNSAKSKSESVHGISDVNINIATDDGILVKDSEIGPPTPSGKPTPKKKKKQGKASRDMQNNQLIGIPDLNGNGITGNFSVADSECMGRVGNEQNEMEMKAGLADAILSNAIPGVSLVDLQVPEPISLDAVSEHSKQEGVSARLPASNPGEASTIAEPAKKRRRRTKEKPVGGMPDIKNYDTVSEHSKKEGLSASLPASNPGESSTTAQPEKKRRRRKEKPIGGMPDIKNCDTVSEHSKEGLSASLPTSNLGEAGTTAQPEKKRRRRKERPIGGMPDIKNYGTVFEPGKEGLSASLPASVFEHSMERLSASLPVSVIEHSKEGPSASLPVSVVEHSKEGLSASLPVSVVEHSKEGPSASLPVSVVEHSKEGLSASLPVSVVEHSKEGLSASLPVSVVEHGKEGLSASLPASNPGEPSTTAQPEKKRRRRTKKAIGGMPDINNCVTVSEHSKEGLSAGLPASNPGEPSTMPQPAKKRRRWSKKNLMGGMPDMQMNIRTNGEASRTALLLMFAPGVSVPSKEVLLSTFCRFGLIREEEVLLSEDAGTAQVVFVKGSDAAEAAKSLEISKPFGATLVNHRLVLLSAPSSTSRFAGVGRPAKSNLSLPIPNPVETPPVDLMRQNLEMMTSVLEKSGDHLSPDMRAQLESEIKGLLKKMSSLPPPSST